MTLIQRAILIAGGLLTFWFSFNVTFDQYGTGVGRPWLATFLWLVSLAMFWLSAKPGKREPND